MASIIHYLERLVDFSRQAGGIVAGNEKVLAELKERDRVLTAQWQNEKEIITQISHTKESIEQAKADYEKAERQGDYVQAGHLVTEGLSIARELGEQPLQEADLSARGLVLLTSSHSTNWYSAL